MGTNLFIDRSLLRQTLFALIHLRIIHGYSGENVLMGFRSTNDSVFPSRILDKTTNLYQDVMDENDHILSIASAFCEINREMHWPLIFSTSDSIVAPFGPILDIETNDQKINRGIDISGFEEDPVVAVYPGRVHKVSQSEVIIEHEFKHWTQVHADKPSTKSWYTVYSNIETDMKVGEEVPAGYEIGQIASSSSPYLHFEVQVGFSCSPGIDCVSDEYYHHVNPLFTSHVQYGPEFDRPEINVVSDIGPTSDGIIEISTPLSQPNLNRFEIQIIGEEKQIRKRHIIDFNNKIGFHNSKIQCIDEFNPFLNPVTKDAELWKAKFQIPSTWVKSKENEDWFRLVIKNIWGKTTYFSFTSEIGSW